MCIDINDQSKTSHKNKYCHHSQHIHICMYDIHNISGCVPKKLMVFASRYPGEIKEMSGYGWKGATEGTFDWKVFLENKNQVCDNLCALLIICIHI